jgi:TPR repeat protein
VTNSDGDHAVTLTAQLAKLQDALVEGRIDRGTYEELKADLLAVHGSVVSAAPSAAEEGRKRQVDGTEPPAAPASQSPSASLESRHESPVPDSTEGHTAEDVERLIRAAFDQIAEFDRLYRYPDIPEKKLSNAQNTYAPKIERKDILGLVDCTVWGSAKDGCLLTTKGLYWRSMMFADPGRIRYQKINADRMTVNKLTIEMPPKREMLLGCLEEKDVLELFQFIKQACLISRSQVTPSIEDGVAASTGAGGKANKAAEKTGAKAQARQKSSTAPKAKKAGAKKTRATSRKTPDAGTETAAAKKVRGKGEPKRKTSQSPKAKKTAAKRTKELSTQAADRGPDTAAAKKTGGKARAKQKDSTPSKAKKTAAKKTKAAPGKTPDAGSGTVVAQGTSRNSQPRLKSSPSSQVDAARRSDAQPESSARASSKPSASVDVPDEVPPENTTAYDRYHLARLDASGRGWIEYLEENFARRSALWEEMDDDGLKRWLIGHCHELGIGLPRNLSAAAFSYDHGARLGEPFAQRSLGWCHETGSERPQDLRLAKDCYVMAAEGGCVSAQLDVGAVLFFQENNITKAVPWVEKAAEQGHAIAQFLMGDICSPDRFEQIPGELKDVGRALKWYGQAAESGHPRAQKAVGRLSKEQGFWGGLMQGLGAAGAAVRELVAKTNCPRCRDAGSQIRHQVLQQFWGAQTKTGVTELHTDSQGQVIGKTWGQVAEPIKMVRVCYRYQCFRCGLQYDVIAEEKASILTGTNW